MLDRVAWFLTTPNSGSSLSSDHFSQIFNKAFRFAVKGGRLEAWDKAVRSLGTAVIATLAVTLLNPHFYLDTVILLGSISSQFHGQMRLYFWIGAVCASVIWFISLSLGGQILAPLFQKQISWRIQPGLRNHVVHCRIADYASVFSVICPY